jgi:FkbH-like protein
MIGSEKPAVASDPTAAILGQLEVSLRDERASAPVRAALAALAELSAERCLQVLGDYDGELNALVESAALSRTVERALTNSVGVTKMLPWLAANVLRRHRQELSPEALSALFAAIGFDLDADQRSALDAALHRFPENLAILRYAINVALRASDLPRLGQLLPRLAAADSSPATTGYVSRLYRELLDSSGPRIRIAIASSFTVDHLVPYVDVACRAVGLVPEIYVAPFNSWATDVIDEASALRRFEPDVLFISVAIDDLIPQLSRCIGSEELEQAGVTALERVMHVARHFTSWAAGKTLVVHSFHSAFSRPRGLREGRSEPSRAEWLARVNGHLAEALRELPSTFLLDVSAAAQDRGGSLSDNPKLRHIAAMRLPPPALAGIADAYARYAVSVKGLTKKCVVVDLDNTLWGGVVGEDGKDGIRLARTSQGSEFVELQEFLRALAERGVLLAVNSKNNPDDALEVIQTHEAMVLREEMFSAVRINWKPKHENMVSIAQELNIGLDSLVFVDDNPDEREQMRQLLPQVLTVDLPRDPTLFRSVLEKLPQLQTLSVTAEDTQRVEQYRTTRLREQAKQTSTSVDEYLQSLEIETEILPASKSTAARIVQLFAKTNQFNVTTRRYDTSNVERFVGDPAFRLWTLSSRDRFGDHGLVAVALVRVDSSWTIDSFLMSCRVIGYGIETALMAFISQRAAAACVAELNGEFVESKKNAPARDLFERHGFALKERGTDGVERWRLDLRLGSVPSVPAWITLTSHDA